MRSRTGRRSDATSFVAAKRSFAHLILELINFTKMQALGNDYVLIEPLSHRNSGSVENTKYKAVAPILCNRNFGVGADGLLVLLPSKLKNADIRMRIFNADGSEAEMCGNGIRCIAKYFYERYIKNEPFFNIIASAKIKKQKTIEDLAKQKYQSQAVLKKGIKTIFLFVETKAGIKQLTLSTYNSKLQTITVNMGKPEFHHAKIPVDTTQILTQTAKRKVQNSKFKPQTAKLTTYHSPLLVDMYQLEIKNKIFQFIPVSMGNPHAVIFQKISDEDLRIYGPLIEHHPAFPRKTNVEFVTIEPEKENELNIKVWERGVGETLSCGTGACASVAAYIAKAKLEPMALAIGYKQNSKLKTQSAKCKMQNANHKTQIPRKYNVNLKGGTLIVEWFEDADIMMSGGAEIVFTGFCSEGL